MPPQQTLQLVVFMFLFEAGQVRHGVVSQPQPVGQTVRLELQSVKDIESVEETYNDDVDRVVTPGQQEEDDPCHAGEQRQPVQGVEPVRDV